MARRWARRLGALVHVEMHADVLPAFDRTAALQRRKEAPFAKGFEEKLVEAWIGSRLEQFDIDRAIGVNYEARGRDGLIRLLA